MTETLLDSVPSTVRPDECYRGLVDGFPQWSPLSSPATAPAPDEPTLLDRILDWLATNIDWFAPTRWDAFFPPREFPGTTILELLLLCRTLRRSPRAAGAEHLIDSALGIAQDVVDSPEFLANLYRIDMRFPYHVWLLALLERLGRDVSGLRCVVQDLIDSREGDATGRDWPCVNVLELRYVLDLVEVTSALPTLPELYAECAISRADPLHVTENEAYGVTHVLFYTTDFGTEPLACDDVEKTRLRDLVRVLLGSYLATDHFDLSAEFLLCAELVGAGSDELVRHGWRRMAGVQREDGAVPGPPYQPAVLAERSGVRADAYVFRTCYHTTLVAALAAAERERRR